MKRRGKRKRRGRLAGTQVPTSGSQADSRTLHRCDTNYFLNHSPKKDPMGAIICLLLLKMTKRHEGQKSNDERISAGL